MWKSWNKNKGRLLAAGLSTVSLGTAAAVALACGGDWEEPGPPDMAQSSWLVRLLEKEAQARPLAKTVLARRDDATAATEVVLKQALEGDPKREQTLAAWRSFRESLTFDERREEENSDRYGYDARAKPVTPPARLAWPSGLPPAFALYEEGALAWRTGKPDLAKACWQGVLRLPEDRRKWRAVNAAYMLGRAALSEPETCAARMAECRVLAAAGNPDPEALAAASWGWEARAWLDAKAYEKAVPLYFTQAATGDAGAMVSLSAAVSRLLGENSAVLARVASDPKARPIVSAVILNRDERSRWGWGCPPQAEGQPCAQWRWLDALDAAGVAAREDAVALAWFAYQAGHYDRAAQLAKGSPLPMAAWIRAKMALRAGDRALACRELEKAVAGFSAQQKDGGSWVVDDNARALAADAKRDLHGIWVDYGKQSLAEGDYAQALTWFHEAQYTAHPTAYSTRVEYAADADYVAGRVMTCDELKAWVDARPEILAPPPGPQEETFTWDSLDELEAKRAAEKSRYETALAAYDAQESLHERRRTLAIRLVRAGRLGEARPYFHPIGANRGDWAPGAEEFDAYRAALRAAQNPALPRPQRADAWWRAAEMAPAFHGCPLTLSWSEVERPPASADPVLDARQKEGAPPEELARLKRHKPDTAYRYVALDHAWAACALMDDDTDALALRLWTAGKWVAARDPGPADRFYKALVTRCGRTAFGKDADLRRWFPPNPPGQAQPPLRRTPPPKAQAWLARIRAHPWALAGVCAAFAAALAGGMGLRRMRKKARPCVPNG